MFHFIYSISELNGTIIFLKVISLFLLCALSTLHLEAISSDSDDASFNATVYLLTSSKSENTTRVHLINTSSSDQSYSGTLYDQTGALLGDAQSPLNSSPIRGGGRLILSTKDIEVIFGVSPWKGPAMLEVTGNGTFSLMTRLENPSGLFTNTNCATEKRLLNVEGVNSFDKSYLRLINTTDQELPEIRASLYTKSGDAVGAAGTVLVDALDPKEQIWITQQTLVEKFGPDWSEVAMLEIHAGSGVKLINLNYSSQQETFFNFSCSEGGSELERIYLQTSSLSENESLSHIINTSDIPQSFQGTLYNSDGSRLGDEDQALNLEPIAPKSRLVLDSADIEAIFGIPAWDGPAIIEVRGDAAFSLVTKLKSPSGLVSNTNCVAKERVHNVLGYDKTDLSYIRFINLGDFALPKILATLFDAEGNKVGQEDVKILDSLAPKSHAWVSRDQIADAVGSTWNGTGTLTVSSSPSDLRLLNLNLVNNETFFNFSCFEAAGSEENFAPVITNLSDEISYTDGELFSFFVTASDANDDPINFEILGQDSDRFSLDASSGRIVFREVPDPENPSDADSNSRYDFSVSVSDGELTSEKSFSILVVRTEKDNASRNTLSGCTEVTGQDVFGSELTNTIKCELVSANSSREFFVYIPEKYSTDQNPAPLLLSLHGYTSTARTNLSYSGFQELADEEGFLVVYPQGSILQTTQETHWNVGGWTVGSETDDVLFIEELLDHLDQNLSIDRSRVYSTGMSNGGFMSYELVCQLSDRIAAIASVTGTMTPQTYANCKPTRPVSVLQIHGLRDSVVPYRGNGIMTPIDQVMSYWASENNCSQRPETFQIPDSTDDGFGGNRKIFGQCDNDTKVELITLEAMSHEWPIANSSFRSHDLDAATEIWEFLSSFSLN